MVAIVQLIENVTKWGLNSDYVHNPGNSGPWHIDNTGIFRKLTHLKPNTYPEPSQRFKISLKL